MPKLKPKSRRYREAYLRLNAAFPLAFPLNDADIRPLALSIRDQTRAWIDGQSVERRMAQALLGAMQQHCCRLTYQRVVAAGGMRVNLHGEPVEPVTPDGQAHAQGRIAAILAVRAQAKPSPALQSASPQTASTAQKPKAAAPKAAPPPPAPAASKAMPTVIVKKRRSFTLPKP